MKFSTHKLRNGHYIAFCALSFCSLLFSQNLFGQNCDKKTSVFFETDEYAIPAKENPKLDKLCKLFSQKTDSFYLEIDAFTDSIASVQHNYKLAKNRLKTVLAYLKKNSLAHFEVKERVRGEALPLRSNDTEEGRAKNRRVDIYYWKLNGGMITLKGKGGTEIDIQKDYFGPCGICESNPKITEVFTNEEAKQQGISLATTDGDQLLTGGMMQLELSCLGNTSPCADVIIRIPAANYNEKMEVWKSSGGISRAEGGWKLDPKGQLEYDAKNKCYLMTVNYCPGDWINCDVRIEREIPYPTGLIGAPELSRKNRATYAYSETSDNVIYGGSKYTDLIWQFSYSSKGNISFADSGMGKNKIGYQFSGPINRYEAECGNYCKEQKRCWCFEVPLEAYTKLIYFQKKKKYRVKVPIKYKNYTPKLFIPAADTLLPLVRLKGSSRKYTFQLPLPDTYIVVYNETADLKNKRGFDAEVDLAKMRPKYSKRKKYYKVKLKRSQLKKAISNNSSS